MEQYAAVTSLPVFAPSDLENAPIDPKINSDHLGSIPYHTAKYHYPTYFLGRKKWETDRQTHTQTHTQTDGRDQKLYSCPLRWGNYKNMT